MNLLAPLGGTGVDRGLSLVVSRVHLGTGLNEQFCGALLTKESGPVKRGAPIIARKVHVGILPNKKLHRFGVSGEGR